MKKVVIIGGGFAGSLIAKALEKNFRVDLIDNKDYFEFTPGILRTIVEPSHVRKIQVLHSHYLTRANVIRSCVKEVSKKQVILENGKKIKFDYLIIATGSSYSSPIKDNVILASRANILRDYYEKLCKSKSILLIGGGLVGVELAAEISEKYKDKEICIVHSGKNLIERNNPKVMAYANKYLEKRGVKLIFNERVVRSSKKRVITDKGREIKADLIFACTGIKPNSKILEKNFSNRLDEKGFVMVDKNLRIKEESNIFAVGDVNSINEEKTAQNAEMQAKLVYQNILRLENNQEFSEYNTKERVIVVSLGKYNGVFEYKKFVFTGIIPSIMKSLIEKWEMIKKRSI